MFKPLQNLLRIAAALPIIASLIQVNLAEAAGTPAFNNLTGDQALIMGRNVTTGGDFATQVDANATQEVDVRIYYHNTTEGSTAANTTIKVTLPTDQNTEHHVGASISADNVPAVTQTMVNGQIVGAPDLTIKSLATTALSFETGSLRWYPENPATTDSTTQRNLPNGQTGDTITTSGINIGNIQGCFAHSGLVIFRVKLTGIGLPALSLHKVARRAGTSDQFVDHIQANPGDKVEYQVTVKNEDGQLTATNLQIKDTLPTGLSYAGPTTLTQDGATSTLPDSIASNGVITIPVASLKPLDSLVVDYILQSSTTIADKACLDNLVKVTASNGANSPTAQAEVCFLVPTPSPTPTPPTPTPTVTPSQTPPTSTPSPVLPRTGPEDSALMSGGIAGLSLSAARYWQLKRNLKKQARRITIL